MGAARLGRAGRLMAIRARGQRREMWNRTALYPALLVAATLRQAQPRPCGTSGSTVEVEVVDCTSLTDLAAKSSSLALRLPSMRRAAPSVRSAPARAVSCRPVAPSTCRSAPPLTSSRAHVAQLLASPQQMLGPLAPAHPVVPSFPSLPLASSLVHRTPRSLTSSPSRRGPWISFIPYAPFWAHVNVCSVLTCTIARPRHRAHHGGAPH